MLAAGRNSGRRRSPKWPGKKRLTSATPAIATIATAIPSIHVDAESQRDVSTTNAKTPRYSVPRLNSRKASSGLGAQKADASVSAAKAARSPAAASAAPGTRGKETRPSPTARNTAHQTATASVVRLETE